MIKQLAYVGDGHYMGSELHLEERSGTLYVCISGRGDSYASIEFEKQSASTVEHVARAMLEWVKRNK